MIQNKPLLKVSLLVSLIILSLIIASYFPELILTLILSTIFALLLEPFVELLENYLALRRIFSILLVFIVFNAVIIVALFTLLPIAIDKLKELYTTFKEFPFDQKIEIISIEISRIVPLVDAATIHTKINSIIQHLIESLGSITETTVGFLINLVIVPLISFFILLDGPKAIKELIERIPNKYFEMSMNVFYKLKRELGAYLRGLFIESSIVGILNIIALLILGVPYAILIGICAGIANIVPYLGPIVGASLAIIVSFIYGGTTTLILKIIISSIIIRVIDDILLQPLCFGKTLKIHPVAVILILLIGHQLLGIAGMVISIPVATILRVSAIETYWGLKHYSITA